MSHCAKKEKNMVPLVQFIMLVVLFKESVHLKCSFWPDPWGSNQIRTYSRLWKECQKQRWHAELPLSVFMRFSSGQEPFPYFIAAFALWSWETKDFSQ